MQPHIAIVLLASAQVALGAYNRVHLALAMLNTESVPSQKVELPLDHFGGTPGTFKNRWWYNDTFYEAGGPVFLMDAGESNGEGFARGLTENTGQRTNGVQLARKYKGLVIAWEHRYYGGSIPFVQNDTVASIADLDAKQWSFHTTDQALQDVIVFANNFTLPATATALSKLKSLDALKASNAPWIFLGGSYPGMRAAMLRVRNPETIFASWASSAPVQAQVDMRSYFHPVAAGLPAPCGQHFATAIRFFDEAMGNASANAVQTTSLVKNDLVQAFTGSDQTVSVATSDAQLPSNIASLLKSLFNNWQNVGPAGFQDLCTSFETGELDSGEHVPLASATPAQVLASLANAIQRRKDQQKVKTTDVVSSPFENAIITSTVSELMTSEDVGVMHRRAGSSSLKNYSPETAAWGWQWCTQMGFFQIGDPEAKDNVVSTLVGPAFYENLCKDWFPDMALAVPKVEEVLKYGGWKMNPTRVFFTNGEFDPWRTLSVDSTELGAPQRKPNSTVPAFDAAPPASGYFGVVYPGQVHVPDFFSYMSDLEGEKQAFDTGLRMFSAALDEWLPRFTPGGNEKPQLNTGTNGTGVDSGATSGSKDNKDKDNGEKSGASRIAYTSITGVVFAITSVMFLAL